MLEALYSENAHRIAGIPPLADIDPAYIRHLGKPFADGITWDEFTAEIDREQAHLNAQADPRLPIFSDEERRGWSALEAPQDENFRQTLSAHCQACPPISADTSGVEAVYFALAQRLAWWYTLPNAGVEEKNAEFACYRLRCLLSGAGYANWKLLATEVLAQIPECPFLPDEDEETWNKLLIEAHRACGWPTTLGWLNWSSIPDILDEDYLPPDWMKICALIHLFKHMRRADDHLHIVYQGNVEYARFNTQQKRTISTPRFWEDYSRALGKPTGKQSCKSKALIWAAAHLSPDDLLQARPIGMLPGSVLAGPWSTLLPAYQPPAFLRPGVRLQGVWIAANGKVRTFEGEEADALDWAWNTQDVGAHEHAMQDYARSLPRTYPTVAPSRVLASLCPQWVLPAEGSLDRAAYCAIVDAVFCAAILRSGRPDLRREFPLITILPLSPTVEESTNQGKGLTCAAVAGAFVPGIPLLSAPDSTSAPDSRAVAAELEQYGTLALDEFSVPTAKAHVLSRDNLQSLCTGGEVAAGKVYANSGKVRLRQSLVVNAKWLDLSDDLVNRTVPLFLDNLTPEQRSRTDIKETLESGQAAILLRLSAVSLVEKLRLAELGRPPAHATPEAWRYTAHRLLAALILRSSVPGLSWEQAYAAIDNCRQDMGDDLRRHQQLADESGVSALTSSGANLRMSWHSFWATADDAVMAGLVSAQKTVGELREANIHYLTVTQLIRARMEAIGLAGMPFHKLLPAITGQELRVSNHAITRSLTLGMRSFYADDIAQQKSEWHPLPGDLAARWEARVRIRAPGGSSAAANTVLISFRNRGTTTKET